MQRNAQFSEDMSLQTVRGVLLLWLEDHMTTIILTSDQEKKKLNKYGLNTKVTVRTNPLFIKRTCKKVTFSTTGAKSAEDQNTSFEN